MNQGAETEKETDLVFKGIKDIIESIVVMRDQIISSG